MKEKKYNCPRCGRELAAKVAEGEWIAWCDNCRIFATLPYQEEVVEQNLWEENDESSN